MTRAFVALGANLDTPEARIGQALAALDQVEHTRVVSVSSLYRSPPWGVTDQPPFINAVCGLETEMAPRPLLAALLDIERRMGRQRGRRWGPRRIDLDLLLHGDTRLADDELVLPHPRMHQRAFVLVPLAEIAPELDLPGLGTVQALLSAIDAESVTRLPAHQETAVS